MTIGHKAFTVTFDLPYELADWFEQAAAADDYTGMGNLPLKGQTVRAAIELLRMHREAEQPAQQAMVSDTRRAAASDVYIHNHDRDGLHSHSWGDVDPSDLGKMDQRHRTLYDLWRKGALTS